MRMNKIINTKEKAQAFIKSYKNVPTNKNIDDGKYQAFSIISHIGGKPHIYIDVISDAMPKGLDLSKATIAGIEIADKKCQPNYYHWISCRANKDENWHTELVEVSYIDQKEDTKTILWQMGDEQPICSKCVAGTCKDLN